MSSTPLGQIGVLVVLVALPAFAHKGSDVYWTLRANGSALTGRIDVALRDLDPTLHLDANGDGRLTWGEVRAREGEVKALIATAIGVTQQAAPCPLTLGALSVINHSDGVYVALPVSGTCPLPIETVEARYELLFELDPTHRGLLSVSGESGGNWQAFTANRRTQPVTFTAVTAGEQASRALLEGLHHIAIGWDHLCFLFALLLPSVLRREPGAWRPREGLKPTLLDVTKVVTAFTLAHSLTLGLAAFGLVRPNAQAVEVVIAASVALAALNNLFPFVPETRWSLAFSLGLMHGFGFVSAIQDLGADASSLALSVFSFNVGVELGQLAIVALFVPLVWQLRARPVYARLLMPLGSAVILGVALYWTAERL